MECELPTQDPAFVLDLLIFRSPKMGGYCCTTINAIVCHHLPQYSTAWSRMGLHPLASNKELAELLLGRKNE